jgi:hypothetical protein
VQPINHKYAHETKNRMVAWQVVECQAVGACQERGRGREGRGGGYLMTHEASIALYERCTLPFLDLQRYKGLPSCVVFVYLYFPIHL